MKSNNLVKVLIRIMVALPLLTLPAGCGGGGGGSAPATPTIVAITVTPAGSSLTPGASQQMFATGILSNGSTVDLTTLAFWNASALVQISATGLVTAPASGGSGTVAITASYGLVDGSTTLTVTGTSPTGINVMELSVNGSLCSAATSGDYINKACVSVTICNPGTAICRTVNDILLDTGSFGLRVFRQALSGLTLPQINSGSGALAECIHFADLTSIWGSINLASVQLGNEPAVQIPIHVLDASFGSIPAACGNADPDPVTAGFTGILGVGPFAEDCGSSCVGSVVSGLYYSCNGTGCSGTTVPLAGQVQNPVAHLPQDNNGVLVQLPAIPLGGVPALSGSLLLGVGTQANNTPSFLPTVLPTDVNGDFRTVFSGVVTDSFVDTGSNGIFFPSSLPVCDPPNSGWYCPAFTMQLAATASGASGSPTKNVLFNVGNFSDVISAIDNNVFSEVGGTSTFGFDWGLPFFLGRDVFIGIESKGSNLGTGPYVAF